MSQFEFLFRPVSLSVLLPIGMASRDGKVIQEAESAIRLEQAGRTLSGRSDWGRPGAVALGCKGGLKGGKACALLMTKTQRATATKKAAVARWRKKFAR